MKLFLSLAAALVTVTADDLSLQKAIELKYGAPARHFDVITITPTTRALRFDWEEDWWGTFNVVELDSAGKPAYWYDIRDWPSGQSIRSLRTVKLSGHHYIELIDQTHMGNGYLYLYAIRPGVIDLRLKVRVMANLGTLRFETPIATIEYPDTDSDGDDDMVVTARWIKKDSSGDQSGSYSREFRNESGSLTEHMESRKGPAILMD